MNDMSSVIVPKSDQLNADDLIAGPRTIQITEVQIRATPEQPVSIYFDGDDGKPYKPCKSMSRVLVAAWGPDARKYVGRSLTLYRDPKVKWGGMEVGGIRISHMTDIERDFQMALTATKGKRAPYMVRVLEVGQRTDKPQSDIARAKAEQWANEHLAAVKATETRITFDELITQPGAVKAMNKLSGEHPDLHERVTAAYDAKIAAFESDDPFDTDD